MATTPQRPSRCNSCAITWTGSQSNTWDIAETENFSMASEPTGFVAGDHVVFGDDAQQKSILISEDVFPSSITINSSEAYTLGGQGPLRAIISSTKRAQVLSP